MTLRLAYTSGAMLVVTAEGASRRVPAGACRIGPLSASRFRTVRWSENGVERSAQVSTEDLSATSTAASFSTPDRVRVILS